MLLINECAFKKPLKTLHLSVCRFLCQHVFILSCSVLSVLETLKDCNGFFQLWVEFCSCMERLWCTVWSFRRWVGWSRTENRNLKQWLFLAATALAFALLKLLVLLTLPFPSKNVCGFLKYCFLLSKCRESSCVCVWMLPVSSLACRALTAWMKNLVRWRSVFVLGQWWTLPFRQTEKERNWKHLWYSIQHPIA